MRLGERAPAAGAISASVEPLGARQGRCCTLFGSVHETGRRLAIELCANRLRRHWSCVRIVSRLAHKPSRIARSYWCGGPHAPMLKGRTND
jgi:hypothetical protein